VPPVELRERAGACRDRSKEFLVAGAFHHTSTEPPGPS